MHYKMDRILIISTDLVEILSEIKGLKTQITVCCQKTMENRRDMIHN